MDSAVLAGLIGGAAGVAGSMVGATGTFLATRATLKADREKAREQRLAEHEEQAITAAMAAISKVIDTSDEWGSVDQDAQRTREDELNRELRTAGRSLVLMRNRTTSKKISEILYVTRMWDPAMRSSLQRQWIRDTAQYALDTLAAYAREEDQGPEASEVVRKAFENRAAHLREAGRSERADEVLAALEHRSFSTPIPAQRTAGPAPDAPAIQAASVPS